MIYRIDDQGNEIEVEGAYVEVDQDKFDSRLAHIAVPTEENSHEMKVVLGVRDKSNRNKIRIL